MMTRRKERLALRGGWENPEVMSTVAYKLLEDFQPCLKGTGDWKPLYWSIISVSQKYIYIHALEVGPDAAA